MLSLAGKSFWKKKGIFLVLRTRAYGMSHEKQKEFEKKRWCRDAAACGELVRPGSCRGLSED